MILNVGDNINHLIAQIARVKFIADEGEGFCDLASVLEKISNVGKEFKQETTEKSSAVRKDQNGEICLKSITLQSKCYIQYYNYIQYLSNFIYIWNGIMLCNIP